MQAGASLFPFDADEPAEAVLHTHGRVFNSADLSYSPKHVSFSCFVKILGFFFRQLCSGSLGGADLFPSASGSLKEPREALHLSCLHVRHHPFPPPTPQSPPASCHRHLLAGSSASESLLCGRSRRSCVSHEYFFISTEALVSHISSDLLPSAHHPDGARIPPSDYLPPASCGSSTEKVCVWTMC